VVRTLLSPGSPPTDGDGRTNSDNHYIAQAVHDLGSALRFGGTVMGAAGVNKSGEPT
jgi:hypothetical protein